MTASNLRSFQFRREREATWQELEFLVENVERRGLQALSDEDLTRLPILYRATLSSLSVARSISLDRNVLDYLEALAGRAYFCVYGTRRHIWETIVEFATAGFPSMVRHYKWHLALAGFIFLLGTGTGLVLTLEDSNRFYSFVGEEVAQGRDPSASTEELRKVLYDTEYADRSLAVFASFLFTHNAKVGMMAFALGFVLGVPVFLLMFQNGLLLGAFAALYTSRGLGADFWGWVLPHGVTELTAVIFCGGAGLILGHALLVPGRFTRLQNLGREGRRAGMIVLGAVFMFLIAGLIEGIFRQVVHDMGIRYTVVFVTACFWIGYFGLVGRGSSSKGGGP